MCDVKTPLLCGGFYGYQDTGGEQDGIFHGLCGIGLRDGNDPVELDLFPALPSHPAADRRLQSAGYRRDDRWDHLDALPLSAASIVAGSDHAYRREPDCALHRLGANPTHTLGDLAGRAGLCRRGYRGRVLVWGDESS